MSPRITPMTDTEVRDLPARDDAGLGTLRTERGNLPLERLDLRARITGLLAHTELEQGFHNPFDVPLEATYVFPLPDRAAVTGMRMAADDRVIEAALRERGEARAAYDEAIAAGRRASIAEQERPDVFTMRVGNILPGERVTVTLTLAGPLSYEDSEATFRFPLVVAPRYIPGTALDGGSVGDGYALDTDAVPDASRITPPVLLPGFPYPVRLGIEVRLDPGGLPLTTARSSLPVEATGEGWRVQPGQRADRDFVLRLRYGDPVHPSHALTLSPDPDGDQGTFQLTVLPPTGASERSSEASDAAGFSATPARPRDLVLVLDRSGSMRGWKMTAARRAAGRIVDTLTSDDRFAVLTFDSVVDRPDLGEGLVAGTDRHRFRAVEHLASVQARGGTEMLAPLREALSLLGTAGDERDRVLVLVTDGQVGNEDQILRDTTPALAAIRVHTVGIDKAVNAGFLGRLAATGGGRCELVESEDRLDEAMDRIHRRIGAPLVTGVSCHPDRLDLLPDSTAPARIPDLFPGAPLVVTGRYRGAPAGTIEVRGTAADGTAWRATVEAATVDNPALAAVWARAHLRDLEDRYASARRDALGELERRIVATSLRFSVLCRFTAYVAVDTRTVTEGAVPHRVIQPVEPAAGWDMLAGSPPAPAAAPAGAFDMAMPAAAPGGMLRARGPERLSAAGRGMLRRQQPARALRWPVETFAVEAARMRAAASAAEPERRQLLADLASRLDALLRDRQLTADDRLAPLRQLLDEVRGEAALRVPADEFGRLWRRMQDLLDQLTGSTPANPAAPRRGDFWKRA
jgi:Ca-activated chloride channel family protein